MNVSPNAVRAGTLILIGLALYVVWASIVAPPQAPEDAGQASHDAGVTPDAGGSAGWTTVARRARSDDRPDILLFTVDTLRADHVWTYGYERHTTPNLTLLGQRGTRFERAYSTASWTVPAVASLVTGVLPSEHGVRHGFWLDSETVANQEILPEALPTIASTLGAAGYRTMAVVANVHLDPALGFAHGFDSYTALDFAATTGDVQREVDARLGELRSGDQPYFLWVHLIDPHAPYRPRSPYFAQWWPSSRVRYPQIDDFMLEEFLDAFMRRNHIPGDEGLAYAIAAYDSEIRGADAYLGTLLGQLDDGHLAVLFTADHGEEFHDHFRIGHGHTAFEEVVRVPLVVALPGGSAREVATPVSILDVMPTLLEVAGVAPTRPLAGVSLVPVTEGADAPVRDILIETGRAQERVRAIVQGEVKYGERADATQIRGLFDLAADPDEMHNLVATDPERAERMRATMDAALAEAAARRPETTTVEVQLSDRQREQLRALGYAN